LLSGKQRNDSFNTTDTFEVPDTKEKNLSFLYRDEDKAHFMDEDGEEVEVSLDGVVQGKAPLDVIEGLLLQGDPGALRPSCAIVGRIRGCMSDSRGSGCQSLSVDVLIRLSRHYFLCLAGTMCKVKFINDIPCIVNLPDRVTVTVTETSPSKLGGEKYAAAFFFSFISVRLLPMHAF
jgi:translation elongation factor P/translation initiation factor 5A